MAMHFVLKTPNDVPAVELDKKKIEEAMATLHDLLTLVAKSENGERSSAHGWKFVIEGDKDFYVENADGERSYSFTHLVSFVDALNDDESILQV